MMADRNIVILAATQDRDKAVRFEDALSRVGFYVLPLSETVPEYGMGKLIHHNLGPGDFVLVLLSKESVASPWINQEFASVIGYEVGPRSISVIPVYLEKCRAPEFLAHYASIDCSRDFDKGLETVANRMKVSKRLNLRSLPPVKIEALVLDLLKSYGFRQLRSTTGTKDSGFDAVATYDRTDPFGQKVTETWYVQVKAGQARSDVQMLRGFYGQLLMHGDTVTGLFVTTTQLTSAAREWVDDMRTRRVATLRVMEGAELQQLLLARPKLVDKFFGPAPRGQES